MQINYSVFLSCLLLASTRALSCTHSVSTDALMTRYSMLGELAKPLAGTVAKYHADVK